MSTYPDISIQLEPGERLTVRVGAHTYGGTWICLTTAPELYGGVNYFIPGKGHAERIAAAINAAWDEPKAAQPVTVTEMMVPQRHWTPPGIRGEDVLPERVIPPARLDALGGDTPDEAA